MQTKVNVTHVKSKTFVESESFKKLRTNIQFSGKNIKVIAFTSTYPGEGKSEVSYRIACSLAEMGKKTVYVDADLRNSTFVSKISSEIQGELKGLVHCLVGENTLDEVIVNTQNPNFDFVPIGAFPPNPSELLSQEVYAEVVSELREKYDYVIIDTPPAGYVVDGVIASAAADGVIFVISSGSISAREAKNTIAELNNANCKLIGCVLNKCSKKSGGDYGYGYGSGYSHYGYGYGYSRGFASDRKDSILTKLLAKKIKK